MDVLVDETSPVQCSKRHPAAGVAVREKFVSQSYRLAPIGCPRKSYVHALTCP